MADVSASRWFPVAGVEHPWLNEPPGVGDYDGWQKGSFKGDNIEITLDGGGSALDQVLVPGIPGYFGILTMHHILALFTDPNVTLRFEDEDGNRLQGAPVDFVISFTVSELYEGFHDAEFYIGTQTADRDLRVDITGGPVGGVMIWHVHYWYERA